MWQEMNWKQLYTSLSDEERFDSAMEIYLSFESHKNKLISWRRIVYLTIFESIVYTVSIFLILIVQYIPIKYSIPFMAVYLIGLMALIHFKPHRHLIPNYLSLNN